MPNQRTKHRPKLHVPYAELGQFYDDLWPHYDKAWLRARGQLLAPVLPTAKSVCELGCGTGTAALDFARRGLKVFALDLSPAMCRATREKVRKSGLSVHVQRADMRSFRLPEPVDLVTSQWGVINHLPKRAEFHKVAHAVSRALRPGGYFYFDLHQRRLYEKVWSPTVYGESKKLFSVQRGGFDRPSGKGWVHVTLFVRRSKATWERHDEIIEEIEWSQPYLLRALKKAGFEIMRIFDFSNLASPPSTRRVRRGLRTMYLARKKPF
ncbi:MAG: class I SAM-dependent methyltransferase [Candidatus Acidiferrales bacterium]